MDFIHFYKFGYTVLMDDIGRLRKEWGERLCMFAYSYVHSMDVAEDLVQDVFLKILEQKIDLREYNNAGSFLFTILKNKCLDYIKHKAVEVNHMQDVAQANYLIADKYALEDDSMKIITENETRKQLKEAINSLPHNVKEIFIQSKFKDKTYKEIADKYGITTRQVEYQLFKAMQMLKDKMDRCCFVLGILYYYIVYCL